MSRYPDKPWLSRFFLTFAIVWILVRVVLSYLVLQRQLTCIAIGVVAESTEDALPDPCLAPSLVAAVDGLPGTELLGKITPGGSGSGHPEHAREDRPVVAMRAADRWPLRGQQRGDARPLLIGKGEVAPGEHLDCREIVTVPLPLSSTGRVTAFSDRLMTAAELRPGEAQREALGRLGQR